MYVIFITRLLRLVKKLGSRKQVLPTIWLAIVTLTDRSKVGPQSLCNPTFGGVFVLSRFFLDFYLSVGAFVLGLTQISFFFSYGVDKITRPLNVR